MKTKEKTTIDPADIVVVRGWVYRADTRIAGRRCRSQCHLYDHEAERCPGTCFRFDNLDEVVFRKIMPEGMLSPDAVVTVTPMWREYDDKVAEIRREADRAAHERKAHPNGSRGPRKGSGGRPSKGSVFETKGGYWRAVIQVNGKMHTRQDRSKAEVETWLSDLKKQLGIKVKK